MGEYPGYYEDEPNQPLGFFKRFFFACAGSYTGILKNCPSEHNKYIGIGATILLTACLAILSGSFALYTVFQNVYISAFFGLLWGALIFNLDRYIVSSIRKEGKFWGEFGLALPRLFLAILIAFVITKPLELELFRNQISSALVEYVAELEKDAEATLDHKLGLDSIRSEINKVDKLRLTYKELKDGKPTTFDFDEVTDQYKKDKKSFDKLSKSYSRRIQANENRYVEIWTNHAYKQYKTNAKGEKVFRRWAIDPKWLTKQLALKKINKGLQQELDEKRADVLRLEKKLALEKKSYKANMDEELTMAKDKRDELIAFKNEKDAMRKAELPVVLEKARRYGVGFPAKIEALERLKTDSSSMWWTSNLIVLLFILLETSPIFVKLVSKRGPYDYILSRIEHQKKMVALQRISEMNYALNSAVKSQYLKDDLKQHQESEKTKKVEKQVEKKPKSKKTNGTSISFTPPSGLGKKIIKEG